MRKISANVLERFGYLEIGLKRPLLVRSESITNRPNALRLAFVSDLHLRRKRSNNLCQQVFEACNTAQPDVIVLGGDYVDHRSELAIFGDLCQQLSSLAPVMAIAGNHDVSIGLDRIRKTVESGRGVWIEEGVNFVEHDGRVLAFAGPKYARNIDADVRILCAHNPRIWKKAKHRGYDLVLAGHLHGCQWVSFSYKNRLYPGAWFYPYCYLTHQVASSRLIVSRGVSDLIPIRWNCPREVVVCSV
jgi:predicted MPP superfamily phosphohydrolase